MLVEMVAVAVLVLPAVLVLMVLVLLVLALLLYDTWYARIVVVAVLDGSVAGVCRAKSRLHWCCLLYTSPSPRD